MKSVYQEIKEQAFLANMEIPKQNLAIYTWGNVSAVDRSRGVFAIKPSGVPYDKLSVDDMVVVDFEGKKVEGKMNPSSDTPTHVELYNRFEDIGGITHTHSPCAVAWAQAGKCIPILGTTHADYSAHAIPCTPVLSEQAVKTAYEKETGVIIAETFLHPEKVKALDVDGNPAKPLVPHENPMCLVAGHGPFTWGKDAMDSVYHARILEEIAKMAFMTVLINPKYEYLTDYVIDKHYQRKHGKNAYYGQR